ncbi:MAG: UTP--glucose-1-phosphate uridylyltransferase [Verrucomicrobiota bacterium]|nr:UTP--glucose-1-phosphate uridylyltransferase [Verrucomicrobiota bacterium]
MIKLFGLLRRNPLDVMLRRLAKRGGKRILLCWNRGLGDIALGLYAIVHRIQEKIEGAEITFLTRSNLEEGFSLLENVKVLALPHWKRGEKAALPAMLEGLGVDAKSFDLIIEAPNPTAWVAWQRGKLVPRLCWKKEWDDLWQTFPLDPATIYVGIQPLAETEYGLWRNWPLERWKELIHLLGRVTNVKVLLFGFSPTPDFLAPHVIDLRGKTNLATLLSMIKNRCHALVLPDSGILAMVYYLSIAFPIHIISLWGDTNHGILKQAVPSPNPLLSHTALTGKLRDLSALSAETVFDQLFPVQPLTEAPCYTSVALGSIPSVGVIILAGGEGSRLGQGPKGFIPVLGKSLFQHLCDQVPVDVPIAIMTSPLNHEETVAFFEKNDFFGKEVHFFQQPMLPLLEGTSREETSLLSPDGNGGVFQAFASSPLCALFQARGIDAVSVVPIDNPLANPVDPWLLAHLRQSEADVVIKCIEEKEAPSTMGALVTREKGGIEILEYTEIDKTKSYPYRNTAMLAFSLSFFARAAELDLPHHFAWKKRGDSYFWKRERFIFDVLPYAHHVEALCYPRDLVYAPLKELQNLPQIEKILQNRLSLSCE